MTTPHMSGAETAELAQAALRWYGWGSPVGIGLFIVCLSLAALVAAKAVGTLSNISATGTQVERQLPDGRH